MQTVNLVTAEHLAAAEDVNRQPGFRREARGCRRYNRQPDTADHLAAAKDVNS